MIRFTIALLFLLRFATDSGVAQNKNEMPPNILLVMTDDQGFGDVGYHGNPDIQTPVMDKLAQEGAWFQHFYVSSVCAPTRASLLTGRYSKRTGTQWVTRDLESMHPDEVTFAHIFGDAGYETGAFGKWHNGEHYPSDPRGMGFDTFFGFNGGHHNNYFDTWLEYNGDIVETEGYIIDVLTDSTITFIERNHSNQQPFFAYVPYNTPHSPFQVSDEYYDKYEAMGYDARTASAYGMVENIDDNLGRMLHTLDELDIADNTIVLFLTDNGPNGHRYNAFMRGIKASVHEGGVRVPLFIRWPGHIQPGKVVEELTAHIDVLPTLMDLAGITHITLPHQSHTPEPPPDERPTHQSGETRIQPKPVDGISFAGLLIDGRPGLSDAFPDDRLLFFHHSRWDSLETYPGAVRNNRYRLARTYNGWELFDIKADPGEQFDVAHLQPEMADSMRRAYHRWFDDVSRYLPEERRVPVGFSAAPSVTLPAPQSYFEGTVDYHGESGWANDWLDYWRNTGDRIWWYLDVVQPGMYQVEVEYTIAPENTGTRIRVAVNNDPSAPDGRETENTGKGPANSLHVRETTNRTVVEGRFDEAYDPDFLPSPDRLPRGEVYEKEGWATQTLGKIRLEEGHRRLTVQALEIPGNKSIELKSIRLHAVSE